AALVIISVFLAFEARTPSAAPATHAPAQPVAQSATKASAQDQPDSTSLEGLRRLAKQGDTAAQFALGAHYATGEEVQQDYAEAVRWFTMAAQRGHVVAQATLGAYYWAGRGAPQDLTKAYFWSILAQSGGDQASKYRVAVLTSRMSRSQVVAAQEDANQWLQRHQGALSKPSPARQLELRSGAKTSAKSNTKKKLYNIDNSFSEVSHVHPPRHRLRKRPRGGVVRKTRPQPRALLCVRPLLPNP